MKKFVSFIVVALALILTGCDAKWGGTDPVLPPQVNNYSVFPQPQPQVQSIPSVSPSPVTAPLVIVPSQPQLQKAEAQSGSGTRMEKVLHPFRLPSRERPGMWKEVFIKVDLPTGVNQNERNLAIAKHYAKLEELDKHVEDYLPLARSGPRQAR